MQSPAGARAGFRDRAAAALIDAGLLYLICRAVEALARAAGRYLPFELTFLALGLAYSIVALAWRGATVGKAAVGAAVCTLSGERVGPWRAALRELVGKPLSALPLAAGFLVAAGGRRRGWHDRLAGTVVVLTRHDRGTRLAVAGALGAATLLIGLWLAGLAALVLEIRPMLSDEPRPPSVSAAPAVAPIEVSRIDTATEAACAAWLQDHGRPAGELLAETCARWPVVIVGEQHWQREAMAFLCAQLPALHRSGVRSIAMEWLLAEDDEAIARLVTAPTYDPALALELARHQPWRSWGWKGYLDVLESAWRLNSSLGPGEEPLRIVGIDLPIDLPSVALSGIGDEAVDAPAFERLRVVRMLRELPKAALRDAFMARQVERSLEADGRVLVWVGAAHSSVGCRGPGQASGWGRMGFLLAQRHLGAVTQIGLHAALSRARPGVDSQPGISAFVERLMARRADQAWGWTVTDSPFEALRDSSDWSFSAGPEVTLGDLTSNLLFLAPRARLTRCEWLAGFVDERMLAEYRPYYEAIGRRTGVEVTDPASANLALSRQ